MYIMFPCVHLPYALILPPKVITGVWKVAGGAADCRINYNTLCDFMKERVLLLMLFVCLGVGLLRAQTRQVTGVVTAAEDGLPVAGASILVKGSSQGTITDVEGRFVLSDVPASATTLVISFVGMKSCEVPVSDRVEVVLENEQQVLDEVLVTVAYGTAKRSSLTGAISSVDQKQIELRPTSSVTSALEGSTSGVQINSTYGAPGSTPDIRIRGIGTVNGSSSPLYVVDGVPFSGSIADINPADIESLSVLKDAASCALYGNRASNGVILITTKKGTAGRLSLDLKVNQGIYTRGIKEYARTDVRQFMEASWQNLRNARISAGDDPATAARYASDNLIGEQLYLNIFNKPDKELFDASGRLAEGVQVLPGYAEDLDWYKAAIRKGYRQEYVLSGNAASEKSDYYFSLGYLNEEGYVRNSAFDRLSARVSVNLSPVSWIKAGVNLSGSHQNSKITAGDQGASFTNAFMYCREIAPIYPVHLHNADGTYRLTADGKRQYDPGYYTDDKGVDIITRNQYADRHVVWENELDKNETVRNTLQSIAYMDVKFLKDFTFTVKGDMNLSQSDNSAYDNAVIGNGKGSGGRTNQTTYRYKSYTFQQQLKWTHLFGNHLLDVLLAHENFSYNYNYSYGFKSAQIFAGRPNYGNFTEITSLDGYEDNYRTESYLGRIRYNFRDRYNLEVSFRRDGSSRFHPDNRWGNFGSVGANWIISEEDFMKDVHWVNELKLRANYGQVENDAGAGYYGYMSLYTIAQNAHKGALYLNQNDSYGLKWETGEAYGVAVETRLFDRWNLSVEYFDKRNKDLLFDIYLPLSAGGTSTTSAEATVTRNLGTISNRGFEINTDVDIVRTKDWTVNLAANATFLKNKIVKLPEQNKDGIISGVYKIVEGKSRYEFYTYTFEGVDQLTGNSLYKANLEDYYVTLKDGTTLGNKNGVDITSKATVIGGVPYVTNTTYGQREFHGSALPTVYGSLTGTIGYKSLTLSALFTYSLGGKTMDAVYQSLMTTGTSPSNYHADIMQSWTKAPEGMDENSPNRIRKDGIPQINSMLSSDNNAVSSRWLTSADYLVVKNLTLSYRLPQGWVEHVGLQSVGLNVSCENLWTFAARQGMNPQQSFAGAQGNYLVTPRIFSVGVSVKL